jgi:hypothetical protein
MRKRKKDYSPEIFAKMVAIEEEKIKLQIAENIRKSKIEVPKKTDWSKKEKSYRNNKSHSIYTVNSFYSGKKRWGY